jgi:hypothetical protein
MTHAALDVTAVLTERGAARYDETSRPSPGSSTP